MRVLLGTYGRRLAQAQYFHAALRRHGIASKIVLPYVATNGQHKGEREGEAVGDRSDKVVVSHEVMERLSATRMSNWLQGTRKFRRLMADFRPSVVYADTMNNFTLASINQHIPTVISLGGDVWAEHEWAKSLCTSLLQRATLAHRFRIYQKCLARTTVVWSVSHYLDRIVRSKLPDKQTSVFAGCMISTDWVRSRPHKLKHPCVGILQQATILGKVQEMKILREVIPKFPDVTFYWAGSGNIEHLVLGWLGKFPNFKRLGRISYPEEVRNFLSEVDILAQITGIDMLPRSLLEAQLVGTPVLATDIGGCHEAIVDHKTGYLVKQGDPGDLCDKIELLLQDKRLSANLGQAGRQHVLTKFDPDQVARDFVQRMSALQ